MDRQPVPQRQNNAQILRNNACTVAAYRGATNNLMASISGPTTACPLETVCFFANVSGAPGPYTYQWAWTTNGFTYTNFGTGSGACLSMFGNFFPPQLITIRLIVTAGGQTVTTYHDVNLIESDAIFCPQFKAQVGGVIDGAAASLNVGPNPADVRTTATLYLPEDAPTKVGLYDLSGKLVREITNETLEAGTHAIQINLSTIPPGVYLLQATSEKVSAFEASRHTELENIPHPYDPKNRRPQIGVAGLFLLSYTIHKLKPTIHLSRLPLTK